MTEHILGISLKETQKHIGKCESCHYHSTNGIPEAPLDCCDHPSFEDIPLKIAEKFGNEILCPLWRSAFQYCVKHGFSTSKIEGDCLVCFGEAMENSLRGNEI